MAYLRNNGLLAYKNGKMTADYFRVRSYLMKQGTQTIKNICIMLCEEQVACSIYNLADLAGKYVRKKQMEEQMEKQREATATVDEYNIDVEDFLK